jgi:hypothetical protein
MWCARNACIDVVSRSGVDSSSGTKLIILRGLTTAAKGLEYRTRPVSCPAYLEERVRKGIIFTAMDAARCIPSWLL